MTDNNLSIDNNKSIITEHKYIPDGNVRLSYLASELITSETHHPRLLTQKTSTTKTDSSRIRTHNLCPIATPLDSKGK